MSEEDQQSEAGEFSPPKLVVYKKGEIYLGLIEDGAKYGSGIFLHPSGNYNFKK